MRDTQAHSQNSYVVTVVMPVFNEIGTLETVLHAVLNQPCVSEVITAADHSTDHSFELLEDLAKQEARLKVLRHKRNEEKAPPCELASAKPLRTSFSSKTRISNTNLQTTPRCSSPF
jgi:cellulose synthase/poly-beta-1,6-N-acetylglucosamine synthase-like glycosyltransferase